MKLPLKKPLFSLLFSFLMLNACVPAEDKIEPQLFEMETDGWIYSDLLLKGLDFDLGCGNNEVTLTKEGNTIDLEITDCLISILIAQIPENLDPGNYSIIAEINGKTFTEIDGLPMEVEVKNRPVVFPLSSTNIKRGEAFEITGLHLLNETNIPEFNPLVWIMKDDFTNTVSSYEVSADGNSATIILDEDIEPGNYRFKVTAKEWSNEYDVIIL
ncbi:MAG: hypothetical protein ACI8YQ_000774 [Polaribacter sp.]|jgi:hypothetical protein